MLKKKLVEEENKKEKRKIFNRDEIKNINTLWTESPFTMEMLNKFFDTEKLAKKCKKL